MPRVKCIDCRWSFCPEDDAPECCCPGLDLQVPEKNPFLEHGCPHYLKPKAESQTILLAFPDPLVHLRHYR